MSSPGDWIFYHALYHLLAHWAAFVATLGLFLMTMVVVFSTTSPAQQVEGIRKFCCVTVVALALLGAWFFLWRMSLHGGIINQMLPEQYLGQLPAVSSSRILLIIAAVAALLIAALSPGAMWWPRKASK